MTRLFLQFVSTSCPGLAGRGHEGERLMIAINTSNAALMGSFRS